MPLSWSALVAGESLRFRTESFWQMCKILNPRRFLTASILVVVALNLANMVSVYVRHGMGLDFGLGVVPLFNFDRESNLPTLFNGLLLGFGSCLAWWISAEERSAGTPTAGGWKGVALVLGFLFFDELCHIHETVGVIIRGRFQFEGAIYWPWVIPYAVLALVTGMFFVRFFFLLKGGFRWCFAVAGSVYVGAAIGLEMVEAAHVERHGEESVGYGILYTIEESLEMLAVIIADTGFLMYLRKMLPGSRLEFKVAGEAAGIFGRKR